MEFNKNDNITILNYQGSKKNLLNFIYNNIEDVIDENKAFMDIFTGSCAVGSAMKKLYTVYANDSELYSAIIAKSLLQYNLPNTWSNENIEFHKQYVFNKNKLKDVFKDYLQEERNALKSDDFSRLQGLYENYPSIWSGKLSLYNGKITSFNDLRQYRNDIPFMLFCTYYANTYFGIEQSIEIDSIRYAIEHIANNNLKNVLLSALFFGMKECVFSKDGHMAQPLDIYKNTNRLLKTRGKSVYDNFIKKVDEFNEKDLVPLSDKNKVFNLSIDEILKLDDIKKEVGFIYADPPYTDMQYSRYYHLLNTVALYDYDDISKYRGNYSKGLYRASRFQSPLSQRGNAQEYITELFNYCKTNKINLGFSFAYPMDTEKQATNRYTMSIDNIIKIAEDTFSRRHINIFTEEYEHSNNRNSHSKKVLEYLIVCKN